jgi:hypothetical protein
LRFITYLTPSLPIELFELVARLAPTAEAALEVLA